MRLPIDTAGMTFLCAVEPTPVVDFESRRQRADVTTGEPLYAVQLVALTTEGAEIFKVTVAGEPTGVDQGQAVAVSGLTANYWQMGDRSGISFRAARLESTATTSAARPGSSSTRTGS